MPTWRHRLEYRDSATGLSWSVNGYKDDPNPAALLVSANIFNDYYLAVCSDTVGVLRFVFSDVAVYRDIGVIAGADMTTSEGQQAAPATEISSVALLRLNGQLPGASFSILKLHGIAQDFVVGSLCVIAGANKTNLELGAVAHFWQYRPVATPNLPAVNPPLKFDAGLLYGQYTRRLGRPFVFVGQQHAYRRH